MGAAKGGDQRGRPRGEAKGGGQRGEAKGGRPKGAKPIYLLVYRAAM